MEDNLYLFYILLLILVPLLIVILCRKFAPNKLWLGMLLSVVFAPMAHFYLKKGGGYFFIVALNSYLLHFLIDSDMGLIAVTGLLSAVLMFLRFKFWSVSAFQPSR